MRKLTAIGLFVLGTNVSAQTASTAAAPRIQDNSFLVEEAYNQETGVVQHIGTYLQRRGSSGFDFGFAQEWPVPSIRHQLSYDIPIARAGSSTGVGDIGINYRYQLLGDGDARLAVTPRVSVFLPTGDWKRGRGSGAVGAEIAGAASFVASPLVTTHTNVGFALTPRARIGTTREDVHEFSVGQSVIFTSSSFIQPMLEAVYADGTLGKEFLVSPGMRMAFNFPSGLQIVPGIAVPIGVGPSEGEKGVFVYLSFEHPFKR